MSDTVLQLPPLTRQASAYVATTLRAVVAELAAIAARATGRQAIVDQGLARAGRLNASLKAEQTAEILRVAEEDAAKDTARVQEFEAQAIEASTYWSPRYVEVRAIESVGAQWPERQGQLFRADGDALLAAANLAAARGDYGAAAMILQQVRQHRPPAEYQVAIKGRLAAMGDAPDVREARALVATVVAKARHLRLVALPRSRGARMSPEAVLTSVFAGGAE